MLTEQNMMKRNTKATTEASSYTKKPRRNCYPLTKTMTITPFPSSHFPRSCTPGRQTSSSSLLWCVILLLLCCPTYVVNGLPLVMIKRSNLGLGQDVLLHASLTFRGRILDPEQLWHWYLQNKNNMLKQEVDPTDHDDDTSNMQEVTGSDSDERDNKVLAMRLKPRQKKGLSYLTKYYSEAFLNNTPSSSGGVTSRSGNAASGNINAKTPHDSATNSFFGVRNGIPSASGELRFPPSVRRKLSFYPAMTSHSVYISPWSRVSGGASGGRSPTMRLRWGK